MQLLAFSLQPEYIIRSGGLLLIGLTVFAESGLLIGFFLPGDTLLFTAGFFAAQGLLPLPLLLATLVVAAIAGDNVGYTLGHRTGHRIFRRKDGVIFRQEYLERANTFYESHGGKTVVLARFVPIVRTFAPVVAGAAKMPRRTFMLYNVIGALLWCVSVTMLGYWLGAKIPNIETYILPAVAIATVLTFSPAVWHILHTKENRSKLAAAIRQQYHRVVRRFRKSL